MFGFHVIRPYERGVVSRWGKLIDQPTGRPRGIHNEGVKSTLVMPFPVEHLRFFDQATGAGTGAVLDGSEPPVAVDTADGPHRSPPAAGNGDYVQSTP